MNKLRFTPCASFFVFTEAGPENGPYSGKPRRAKTTFLVMTMFISFYWILF